MRPRISSVVSSPVMVTPSVGQDAVTLAIFISLFLLGETDVLIAFVHDFTMTHRSDGHGYLAKNQKTFIGFPNLPQLTVHAAVAKVLKPPWSNVHGPPIQGRCVWAWNFGPVTFDLGDITLFEKKVAHW